MTLKPVAQQ